MMTVPSIQKAIHGESLDGWLFCNFAHRDRLTDDILGLDRENVSSRRWFYLVPSEGNPVKIVHAIEKGILDSLPGARTVYSSREELEKALSFLGGKRIAVLSDPYIQVLSTMDASSWRLAVSSGAECLSAAPVIQRVKGLLTPEGIESHENAAAHLYRIVGECWNTVRDSFRAGTTLHEGDILKAMLEKLHDAGLITDHPPIVAAGAAAGDPHYEVRGQGNPINRGDVLQFDIWAKRPGGIYADISWVGYCDTEVPDRVKSRFANLLAARDLVKPEIERAFAEGRAVSGFELDSLVRNRLLESFPPEALRHRTGHGIDTDCHGSGVNLDSVEFPDHRVLLEGSCFSVEPGVYFEDCGFRTEIDIYVKGGQPIISGPGEQRELLTL